MTDCICRSNVVTTAPLATDTVRDRLLDTVSGITMVKGGVLTKYVSRGIMNAKGPSGSGLALGLGISGLHKDDADYFTLYSGSRNESTIVFTRKSEQTSQHETKNVKTYDLTT